MLERVRLLYIFLLFTVFFSGCGLFKKEPIEIPPLTRISLNQYPDFADDLVYDGLDLSILQSITYLKRIPADTVFRFGNDHYTAAHMIESLEFFLSYIRSSPTKQDLRQFIQDHFLVYRSVGNENAGEVLFTGYYEPFLEGSLSFSDVYRFPVYTRPDDLVTVDLYRFSDKYKGAKPLIGRVTEKQKVIPYYERMEIVGFNRFKEKARPLAWVKDPVDLFFLQIQGSGKIFLNNGESINVHYDTSNGHPYRSIGKLLIDQGKIPRQEMSMQRIRSYLKNHQDEIRDIFNYNKSYVFFKQEVGGPFGCLSVKLTPGRSVALDKKIFPAAALTFIETKKPLSDGSSRIQAWMDFSRFVLNQDTGGAIKGPGRADLFWGNGEYAEVAAGYMRHPGSLYLLIMNPEAAYGR